MKKFKKILAIGVGCMSLAASAQAVVIDFTGLEGTTDPAVGSVSFWAGDPTSLNDTYVDDFHTPGNPYLLNGFDDGTGNSPGLYDTLIGVSKSGTAFGSVGFDIASEYTFPSFGDSTTLWVRAFLAGIEVGSASVGVSDTSSHTLGLSAAGGFDKLYIYDDLNSFGLGEDFQIDNFNYTEYQAPCTGPGCNPPPQSSARAIDVAAPGCGPGRHGVVKTAQVLHEQVCVNQRARISGPGPLLFLLPRLDA